MATGYDRNASGFEALDVYTNRKYHKWINKKIYTERMKRIYKTGKIYSFKERIEYPIYRVNRLFNRAKTIIKGEIGIKEWWNKRRKELQNGK